MLSHGGSLSWEFLRSLKNWCNSNSNTLLSNWGIEFKNGTSWSLVDMDPIKIKFETSSTEDSFLDINVPWLESNIGDSVFNEEWFVDPKETELIFLWNTTI